ncbi:hypothetical protein OQA88_750 [Cercophora sp. LCS_1]
MKALVFNIPSKSASVQNLPTPTLPAASPPGQGQGQNKLLVRVAAVALNPVDALYVARPIADQASPVPRIVGADFSGVVVDVPSAGESDDGIRTGQLVAGFLQGANSSNHLPGAFAEFLTIDRDLVWKVPEGVSPEQAAAVSLCGLTAAQMVFWRLGMPAPFPFVDRRGVARKTGDWEGQREASVFVYGASTSVGMYAAQLVRKGFEAVGVRVKLIGAASRGRWAMLKGETYGYDELVDYREEGWVDKVREVSGGEGVDYALDCISEGSTVRSVHGALRQGAKVAIVRSREGGAWSTEGVPLEDLEYGAVWEGLGADVAYSEFVVRASREAREFAAAFYRWLSEGGNLEPNPVRLMPGGLERVMEDGFSLLGSGLMEDRQKARTEEWMQPVQAEKLVYRI